VAAVDENKLIAFTGAKAFTGRGFDLLGRLFVRRATETPFNIVLEARP
jgi:hypothetical protein